MSPSPFSPHSQLGSLKPSSTPLEIVPVADIQPHEDFAFGHENELARSILEEGVLRHPIIVTRIGRRLVLLDGTHRLEFLRRHGFEYVLAQVVALNDQTAVRLATWAHLATVDHGEFFGAAAAEGLTLLQSDPIDAELQVLQRQAICWVSLYKGGTYVVRRTRRPQSELRSLVGLYEPERLAVEDLRNATTFPEQFLEARHPQHNLIVRFGTFTAHDIQRLAEQDERIPAGISRVMLVGGRVLGANIGLDLLKPGASAEQQKSWLAQLEGQTPRIFEGPADALEPLPRRYAERLCVYDPALPVLQMPIQTVQN